MIRWCDDAIMNMQTGCRASRCGLQLVPLAVADFLYQALPLHARLPCHNVIRAVCGKLFIRAQN
jgi:hypothetical protein